MEEVKRRSNYLWSTDPKSEVLGWFFFTTVRLVSGFYGFFHVRNFKMSLKPQDEQTNTKSLEVLSKMCDNPPLVSTKLYVLL